MRVWCVLVLVLASIGTILFFLMAALAIVEVIL